MTVSNKIILKIPHSYHFPTLLPPSLLVSLLRIAPPPHQCLPYTNPAPIPPSPAPIPSLSAPIPSFPVPIPAFPAHIPSFPSPIPPFPAPITRSTDPIT